MALTASSALAAKSHLPISSFGPEGPSGSATFASVQGVAVDQVSGNVYVYDTGAGSIYKFDSTGEPVNFSSTATNVIEGVGGDPRGQLAVAPAGSPGGTAGDLYFAKDTALLIFAPSGAQVGELTSGSACRGVATDPSGHVFVDVFPHTVQQYTPTANAPFAADLTATSKASFPEKVAGTCNVAADSLGNIYAASPDGAVITKFEGIEADTATLIEPGAPTLAAHPVTDDLYADRGDLIAQYDSAGNLISASGSGLLSNSRGVAVNGGGDIYAGNGTTVEVFDSAVVLLPDVAVEAATEVKRTTATLHGTISAAGGPATTSCEFQYTSEENFNAKGFEGAASVPCEPAGPFSGTAVEAVKAEVSGLSIQTTYRFRLVGANENGVNSFNGLSFETAPAVRLETDKATVLSTTNAVLNGTIKPEGLEIVECNFLFLGSTFEVIPCAESPAEIGTGDEPVPVHAEVSGLAVDTNYLFLLTASNELGEGEGEVKFFEFGLPLVGEEAPTDITTTSAKLNARVNPNNLATSYAFEYVSEADFLVDGYAKATVVPVPPEAIGGGSEPVEVAQQVSGLLPQTTYYFRVVASNEASDETELPVHGDGAHFTTFPAKGPPLPDGRAYEMVSPSLKKGEVIPPEPTKKGSCKLPCLPGIQNQGMPMQSTPDGNSALYVGQPFSAGLISGSNEYLAQRGPGGWGAPQTLSPPTATGYYAGFSTDLSRGVLSQIEPALSPAAPVQGGKAFANLYLSSPGGSQQPLVTATPPHRSPREGADSFTVFYAGANSGSDSDLAFSHIVFEANDALTSAVPPFAPQAPEVAANQNDLYEWSEGQLRLVNVLPGNAAAAPDAVIGSGRLLSEDGSSAVDQAISADGSRIFWSDKSTGQVYVRIDGEETVEIPDSDGTFLTGATDGSKVLLSDGHIYGDLEAEPPVEEADLTHGEGGFEGILGAADDLSYIYFVDTAALPGAGENQEEEEAQPGAFNIYAWHEGSTAFVDILPNNNASDFRASSSSRSAQVTPDGSFLAFTSNASGVVQVYEYAATSDSLSCVSCGTTGQEPLGPSNLSVIKLSPASPPLRHPNNLSPQGNGRLFFESQDVLSPQDTNGRIQDVYEWEPGGVGSCERAKGCVSLISSGHSANDSMFLDSSESGDDAFFVTRERLLGRDKDDQLDLYDARVGGGFAEPSPVICGSGEACLGGTPPPPAPQSPGSASFSGPANKKPGCQKPKKCHKQKKKKHEHKKHRKSAKHNRGGKK